jgi:DNA replication protein DnaC
VTTEAISPDLQSALRQLRLSGLLQTLPERLALAKAQNTPIQDFLVLLFCDEALRRNNKSAILRGQRAHLDFAMQLEAWDQSAKVTYDKVCLNELISLRFIETHAHVAIIGPVGVGKTFLAHALGHIACRRGYSVLALRADHMLKTLRHAKLDDSYEAELRKLIAIDLLIIDDFGLDTMNAEESRDIYEIFTERHRASSMIITSNRGPEEWIATFADQIRAQSAIDRFSGNSYDFIIEGESYRSRQKPSFHSNNDLAKTFKKPKPIQKNENNNSG